MHTFIALNANKQLISPTGSPPTLFVKFLNKVYLHIKLACRVLILGSRVSLYTVCLTMPRNWHSKMINNRWKQLWPTPGIIHCCKVTKLNFGRVLTFISLRSTFNRWRFTVPGTERYAREAGNKSSRNERARVLPCFSDWVLQNWIRFKFLIVYLIEHKERPGMKQ